MKKKTLLPPTSFAAPSVCLMVTVLPAPEGWEVLGSARETDDWLRFLVPPRPECGVLGKPDYGEWAP